MAPPQLAGMGLGKQKGAQKMPSGNAVPALFTTGADIVDSNGVTGVIGNSNSTRAQRSAIADGADIYHGLGADDVVTLPDENAAFLGQVGAEGIGGAFHRAHPN
jgi:hypothetical protein